MIKRAEIILLNGILLLTACSQSRKKILQKPSISSPALVQNVDTNSHPSSQTLKPAATEAPTAVKPNLQSSKQEHPVPKTSIKRTRLRKRVTPIAKKTKPKSSKLPNTRLIARTFPIKPNPTKVTTPAKQEPPTTTSSAPNKQAIAVKLKEISSLELMSAYRLCWPILSDFYKSHFQKPEKIELKVKLIVAPTGKVASVAFIQNTSKERAFDKAVLEALQKVSFSALDTEQHKKVIMAFTFPD